MLFCILIMVLGIVGNVMVPIVILKTKDMRNSTNIFLTNLSIADLLVLLICTPTVLFELNTKPETWVLGQEMCKAVPFVELMAVHASVLTILAISFERYYAIVLPLRAGYICTKTRAFCICICTWAVASLFTSPILSIATYQFEKYVDDTIVAVCLTSVDSFWPASFFVSSIAIFFVLPFIILVVLYTVIAKHLFDNPGIIQGQRHNVLKYRKQVILMLGAVVLSFFLCLLPFRIFTFYIIIATPENIMEMGIEKYYIFLYFCRIMLYLNSAMNPILYNIMSTKFREGFLRLLGCKSMVKSKMIAGTRKGTFHTTSTNLSSSQNDRRRDTLKNYEIPAIRASKDDTSSILSNSISDMPDRTSTKITFTSNIENAAENVLKCATILLVNNVIEELDETDDVRILRTGGHDDTEHRIEEREDVSGPPQINIIQQTSYQIVNSLSLITNNNHNRIVQSSPNLSSENSFKYSQHFPLITESAKSDFNNLNSMSPSDKNNCLIIKKTFERSSNTNNNNYYKNINNFNTIYNYSDDIDYIDYIDSFNNVDEADFCLENLLSAKESLV